MLFFSSLNSWESASDLNGELELIARLGSEVVMIDPGSESNQPGEKKGGGLALPVACLTRCLLDRMSLYLSHNSS